MYRWQDKPNRSNIMQCTPVLSPSYVMLDYGSTLQQSEIRRVEGLFSLHFLHDMQFT